MTEDKIKQELHEDIRKELHLKENEYTEKDRKLVENTLFFQKRLVGKHFDNVVREFNVALKR